MDKWESDVYVVIKRAGDLPVQPETRDGPKRTLHRDLLLPCGFLPLSAVDEDHPSTPVRRPRTRQHPLIETSSIGDEQEEEDDSGWIPQCSVPLLGLSVDADSKAGNSSVPQQQTSQSFPSTESPPVAVEEMDFPDSTGRNHLPGPVETNVDTVELLDALPGPVETNVDSDELPVPEEENQADDNLPEGNSPVEAAEDPECPVVEEPAEAAANLETGPHRLQYARLGNPLISLFQNLLSAYTDALSSSPSPETHVV